MHNLYKNPQSVDDAYKASKKNLQRKIDPERRNSRGKFADDNEDLLKSLHNDYNDKAERGQLCTLVPKWERSDDPDNEYQLALGMYGSDRPVINNHRDWLRDNNHYNRTELICPICSLKPIEEMDHFAPKSIFPEYATHLNNLIPLCHRCNKKKDDDWIETTGDQTYFNAFYDRVKERDIFSIRITIGGDLNYNLEVELNGNEILNLDPPIYNRIKRTFEKQELKKRYEEEIRSVLDNDINRLRADYSVHKDLHADIRAFQRHHQETWQHQLDTDSFDLISDFLLYRYLQSEPEVTETLFDRICNAAE